MGWWPFRKRDEETVEAKYSGLAGSLAAMDVSRGSVGFQPQQFPVGPMSASQERAASDLLAGVPDDVVLASVRPVSALEAREAYIFKVREHVQMHMAGVEPQVALAIERSIVSLARLLLDRDHDEVPR